MVAMGNGLISERTATAMAEPFRRMKGDDLENRLMSALEAGRDAGGQHGGQHSAALVLYRAHEYAAGATFRSTSMSKPIGELRRVFDLYRPQIEYYETPTLAAHRTGRRRGLGRGAGAREEEAS